MVLIPSMSVCVRRSWGET